MQAALTDPAVPEDKPGAAIAGLSIATQGRGSTKTDSSEKM